MREPVEALTCELPLCEASLMAPSSRLSVVAARAGWSASFCPTHSRIPTGLWRVYALARQERTVHEAAAALTDAGGQLASPPEWHPGWLWRVSVTCQGMDRAVQLAHVAFGVGAAAACSPTSW